MPAGADSVSVLGPFFQVPFLKRAPERLPALKL
nr:MAG TPA: hypothetical protein [Caudoviricetes sp.]